METLTDNFVKAIGWAILHSLWQGAIIYAMLLLILLCIPNAKAIVKHNLAFGAMCLTFILFLGTFTFLISQFSLKEEAHSGLPGMMINLSNVKESISSQVEHFFPLLVYIYLTGMVVQLLLIYFSYHKTSKLKRVGLNPVPADWLNAFDNIISQMHFKRRIAFHLSSEITVPLVFGYFKPIILFPIALISNLDLNQVEAILIHELSHIRRNDYILNLVKKAIEAVLFFNPFIWLSGKFVQTERENACDDTVLKITGAPLTYAHALLKLELLKSAQTPALSMAAAGNGQHLYERIKRITDMKTSYVSTKQQILAFVLILTVIISFAWINPLKAERNDFKTLKAKFGLNKDNKIMTVIASLKNSVFVQQDTTLKKKVRKVKIANLKVKTTKYDSSKKTKNIILNKINIIDSANSISIQSDRALYMIQPSNEEKEVLMINPETAKSINSSEWKMGLNEQKLIAEQVSKHVNSTAYKKQLTAQLADLKKHVQSKKFVAERKALLAQSTNLQNQFTSPEWKRQHMTSVNLAKKVNSQITSIKLNKNIAMFKINAENFDNLGNIIELDKNKEILNVILKRGDMPLNSIESKEQSKSISIATEEMQKYFNSPEFKLHLQELKKIDLTLPKF
jgi:bla regulator protein BlaR1